MENELKVGGVVIAVDSVGRQHNALVTAIHGTPSAGYWPCINVVYLSADASKQDAYGRQIERFSSFVYRTTHQAHGMYYMFPGETPNPVIERQA